VTRNSTSFGLRYRFRNSLFTANGFSRLLRFSSEFIAWLDDLRGGSSSQGETERMLGGEKAGFREAGVLRGRRSLQGRGEHATREA
jgi:hypothetical protein